MKFHYKVSDMSCSHCKAAIENSLRTLNVIVEVNLESQEVTVEGNVSGDQIKKAITDAGYTPEPMQT